jgi:hypothetical protein
MPAIAVPGLLLLFRLIVLVEEVWRSCRSGGRGGHGGLETWRYGGEVVEVWRGCASENCGAHVGGFSAAGRYEVRRIKCNVKALYYL